MPEGCPQCNMILHIHTLTFPPASWPLRNTRKKLPSQDPADCAWTVRGLLSVVRAVWSAAVLVWRAETLLLMPVTAVLYVAVATLVFARFSTAVICIER